eukprot:g1011.t1
MPLTDDKENAGESSFRIMRDPKISKRQSVAFDTPMSEARDKFSVLGSQIQSLIDASMSSDSTKSLSPDRSSVIPEMRVKSVAEVSFTRAEVFSVVPEDFEEDDSEIVEIGSKGFRFDACAQHDTMRPVEPVARTLCPKDLATPSAISSLSSRFCASGRALPKPHAAAAPAVESDAKISTGMQLHNMFIEHQSESAFRRIAPTSASPNLISRYQNVTTPIPRALAPRSSTAMVVWQLSPELKFSPGCTSLQQESLKRLQAKFLMRTERRRHRRETARTAFDTTRKPRRTSSNPATEDVVARTEEMSNLTAPSNMETVHSLLRSTVGDRTSVLENVETSPQLLKDLVNEDDMEKKKSLPNDEDNSVTDFGEESWREVIQRSMQTIEKMDLLFAKSECEPVEKDDREVNARIESKQHSVAVADRVSAERDDAENFVATSSAMFAEIPKVTARTMAWWDENNTSVISGVTPFDVVLSAARSSGVRDAGESPNKPACVEAVSEEEEEEEEDEGTMKTGYPHVESVGAKASGSAKHSLQGLMKRVKAMANASEKRDQTSDSGIVRSFDRLTTLRQKYSALSQSISNTHCPQKIEKVTEKCCDIRKQPLLDALPSTLSFNDVEWRSSQNVGRTREIVPLELRSRATSSIVLKLRIQMCDDVPSSIHERRRFSFALQDEAGDAPPMTCREENVEEEDAWWTGTMTCADSARPVCQALELQLAPGATCRVQLCLTSISAATARESKLNIHQLRLARLIVEAVSVVSSDNDETVPRLHFVDLSVSNRSDPRGSRVRSLLKNESSAISEAKSMPICVRAAAKSAASPDCLCGLSDMIDVEQANGKGSTTLDIGHCESGEWRWQMVSIECGDISDSMKVSAAVQSVGAGGYAS